MLSKTGVVIKNIPRADKKDIAEFEEYGATTIYEGQGRYGNLDHNIKPVIGGHRIAGSAVTCLVHPGDNWMIFVAMEMIKPGDILVVASTAPCTDGYFGELFANNGTALGLKGVVLDVCARDAADLKRIGIPVWSRGINSKGTVKETLGSVNVPVIVGGQLITPGDTIIADDDGVTVVPLERTEHALEGSRKRSKEEDEKRIKFKQGILGLDVYDMRPILEEYGLTYYEDLQDYKDSL